MTISSSAAATTSSKTQLEHVVNTTALEERHSTRIALVSGYVTKDDGALPEKYMPHLLNKACYAHKHGYAFIFNQTWGYEDHIRAQNDTSTPSRFSHLDSGTWHVVPYLESVLERGYYDWMMWMDADYIIQNMSHRIEDFIAEWDRHDLDFHVFVPNDLSPNFYFSSWALLIRTSHFGRSVLRFWREYAHGLCPNGNFKLKRYHWRISDQPGLWYALAKAHAEWKGRSFSMKCDDRGFVQYNDTGTPMGPELNWYFRNNTRIPLNMSLSEWPKGEPILWSEPNGGGLGINVEGYVGYWVKNKPKDLSFPNAFALHVKEAIPDKVRKDIEQCQRNQHCYANRSRSSEDDDGGKISSVQCEYPKRSTAAVSY